MKLIHTRVISEQINVVRNGESIGKMVDAMIADCPESETITTITVEITDEDRTALRLLRDDNGSRPANPPFKKKSLAETRTID